MVLLAWWSKTSLCWMRPSNLYAPIASHDSIRLHLTISSSESLIFGGADVSNSYLHGDMDIAMMIQHPSDSSEREAKPGYVCQLTKSIYWTKQTVEIWGSLLDKSLTNWGFKLSKFDHRVYFYNESIEFLTIAIIVEDSSFLLSKERGLRCINVLVILCRCWLWRLQVKGPACDATIFSSQCLFYRPSVEGTG